jgi:hypothetical protein
MSRNEIKSKKKPILDIIEKILKLKMGLSFILRSNIKDTMVGPPSFLSTVFGVLGTILNEKIR